MKNNILVFGTKNFNNSLQEIKEFLNFSLSFYYTNTFDPAKLTEIDSVLVEREICSDKDILNTINKIKNKPLLLLERHKSYSNANIVCSEIAMLPLSLTEISSRLVNLISIKKFNQNSFIKIKEYMIDKNERILKKNNLSIAITEREIQLIEVLFNEKKPLSKNNILKKGWKYSDGVDTHTLETHIYRLRKKISNKFNDEKFITNTKSGYSI